MWLPDKNKLVKVCLHTRGTDVETPWAEDLGEVPGRPGARRVRLGNVPFLHAKPTYGDTLVVDYARDAFSLLDIAGEKMNIAVEGMRGPKNGQPGRAYLAVPYDLAPMLVVAYLDEQNLPMKVTLVHPV